MELNEDEARQSKKSDRTTRGPTSSFATRSRVAKMDVGPRVSGPESSASYI